MLPACSIYISNPPSVVLLCTYLHLCGEADKDRASLWHCVFLQKWELQFQLQTLSFPWIFPNFGRGTSFANSCVSAAAVPKVTGLQVKTKLKVSRCSKWPTQQLSDSKQKIQGFNLLTLQRFHCVECRAVLSIPPFAFSAPIAWEVQKRRETATFTWLPHHSSARKALNPCLSSIDLNRIKEDVAFPAGDKKSKKSSGADWVAYFWVGHP